MSKSKKHDSEKPHAPQLPDAFSLFGSSWRALLLNLDTFLLQALFPIGLGILTAITLTSADRTDSAYLDIIGAMLLLATVATALFVTASLIVTELVSVKRTKTTLGAIIKSTWPHFWPLIGLFILSAVIIVVGFILLIVPGLFALQRLLLAPYFLVEQRLGVIAAMKKSNAAAKANSGAVWGVVWVLVAINVLGLIPGIGWIIGTALTIAYLCAPAIRYLQITLKQSAPIES